MLLMGFGRICIPSLTLDLKGMEKPLDEIDIHQYISQYLLQTSPKDTHAL